MIIWGSTGRDKVVARGEFHCPQCRFEAGFEHHKAQRYFTLYFIPLFPLETLGEYVQCVHCGGQYDMRVLELTAGDVEQLTAPWSCAGCGNNNPAEYDHCIACQAPRAGGPPTLPA